MLEKFPTGAVRDSQEGKPRFDLIPPHALLRVADVFAEGCKKYAARNWESGIEISRSFSSLERHTQAYKRGERDEDHLAHAVANLLFMMSFEGTDMDDSHVLTGPKKSGSTPLMVQPLTGATHRIFRVGAELLTVPIELTLEKARTYEPPRWTRWCDQEGDIWEYDKGIWKYPGAEALNWWGDWDHLIDALDTTFPWELVYDE